MNDRWGPVLEQLRERFAADTDVAEVEAWLSSQGYDRRQIGEILSLLYTDTVASPVWDAEDGPPGAAFREMSLRVQGPHERGRFTADAWGYLVMLRSTAAVNSNDFELLVERALVHVDGRISLTDIRALADDVGFDDGAMGGERPLIH
jgi:Smg protein